MEKHESLRLLIAKRFDAVWLDKVKSKAWWVDGWQRAFASTHWNSNTFMHWRTIPKVRWRTAFTYALLILLLMIGPYSRRSVLPSIRPCPHPGRRAPSIYNAACKSGRF